MAYDRNMAYDQRRRRPQGNAWGTPGAAQAAPGWGTPGAAVGAPGTRNQGIGGAAIDALMMMKRGQGSRLGRTPGVGQVPVSGLGGSGGRLGGRLGGR